MRDAGRRRPRALAALTSAYRLPTRAAAAQRRLPGADGGRPRRARGAADARVLGPFRLRQGKVAEHAQQGPVQHGVGASWIPVAMASRSRFEVQLAETARLAAERIDADGARCVCQSRSGPPQVPWLEPDVCDHVRSLAGGEGRGSVADRLRLRAMEILFRPRRRERGLAEAGIGFARARARPELILPSWPSSASSSRERLDPWCRARSAASGRATTSAWPAAVSPPPVARRLARLQATVAIGDCVRRMCVRQRRAARRAPVRCRPRPARRPCSTMRAPRDRGSGTRAAARRRPLPASRRGGATPL